LLRWPLVCIAVIADFLLLRSLLYGLVLCSQWADCVIELLWLDAVPAPHVIVSVSGAKVECLVQTKVYNARACIVWPGSILCLALEFVCWSLSLCLACLVRRDGRSNQQLLTIFWFLWRYVEVHILVLKLFKETVLH
jgi:hypothetical protein